MKDDKRIMKISCDSSKIKSKYLSHVRQTRYPSPHRTDTDINLHLDKESKSMQLPQNISIHVNNDNFKYCREYNISTPGTCQSENKYDLSKKNSMPNRNTSHRQHSNSKPSQSKINTDSSNVSTTIYTSSLCSFLPSIVDPYVSKSKKPSEKPILVKKLPSGTYIPPKILDFHPFVGLTPELMHVQ